MILGWIGVGLLMLAFTTLLTKHSKWFIPLDAVASVILTIHAIIIKDLPFVVVNGWISFILLRRWCKGEFVR